MEIVQTSETYNNNIPNNIITSSKDFQILSNFPAIMKFSPNKHNYCQLLRYWGSYIVSLVKNHSGKTKEIFTILWNKIEFFDFTLRLLKRKCFCGQHQKISLVQNYENGYLFRWAPEANGISGYCLLLEDNK